MIGRRDFDVVKLVLRHLHKLRPFQRASAPSAEDACQKRNVDSAIKSATLSMSVKKATRRKPLIALANACVIVEAGHLSLTNDGTPSSLRRKIILFVGSL